MLKVALIGAGKMGISHLALLGAHPQVEVVGVSDTSKMVLDVLKRYGSFPVYSDYRVMISEKKVDAVIVSVPTKLHSSIVRYLLEHKKHVFSEKPLCLTADEGRVLVALAEENKVVNQVGYHNKFLSTFQEVKRLIEEEALGEIFHFVGESYGPVVTRAKQSNWRANPDEGGGCLMDYASHTIDLINYILGPITTINGALLKSFYSKEVEDAVFAFVQISPKLSGLLSVNWSDDTYRKMSTSLTIIGSKGKIICDANELKVCFKSHECPTGYTKGWNIKYLTDFPEDVGFYLRGEEYSLQIDYFVKACLRQVPNNVNTFFSAWQTDRAISLIKSFKNVNQLNY